ncbi:hypothetical protein LTR17_014489 [Elasticomyces elasticus]|nr:hypothetical protein LTR17_014489 [Elasticomyces elasticus]
MAGHLEKRKRSSVESKDANDGEQREECPQPKRRRGGQQPTPPQDSIGDGHLKSSRNLIAFDFTDIPSYVNKAEADNIEVGLDDVVPRDPLRPPPPSPLSASVSYDLEFGDKGLGTVTEGAGRKTEGDGYRGREADGKAEDTGRKGVEEVKRKA